MTPETRQKIIKINEELINTTIYTVNSRAYIIIKSHNNQMII